MVVLQYASGVSYVTLLPGRRFRASRQPKTLFRVLGHLPAAALLGPWQHATIPPAGSCPTAWVANHGLCESTMGSGKTRKTEENRVCGAQRANATAASGRAQALRTANARPRREGPKRDLHVLATATAGHGLPTVTPATRRAGGTTNGETASAALVLPHPRQDLENVHEEVDEVQLRSSEKTTHMGQ